LPLFHTDVVLARSKSRLRSWSQRRRSTPKARHHALPPN